MRTNRGTTLLEVMIASVLLAAVIGMTMSILFSTTSIAVKGSVNADIESQGREFLNFALAEFPMAKFTGSITPSATALILGIYTNNTEIAYRVPVSRDNEGHVLPDITVYGYRSPVSGPAPNPFGGDQTDLVCFLRFEADTVIQESASAPNATQPTDCWGTSLGTVTSEVGLPPLPTLEIQVANYDINRDGDRVDTYVRGRILRYTVAPSTSPILATRPNPLAKERLCDNVVLAVSSGSTFNGDMDNDMTADLLFQFLDENGNAVINATLETEGNNDIAKLTEKTQRRRLAVNAWFGNWGENRKEFIVRQAKVEIKMRNLQD